jgi:hypothetical protein
MPTPIKQDMSQFTLVLFDKDNKELFSSRHPGLRPLVELVSQYNSKKTPNLKGCILFDKVTGLAAAKLAVRSGIISYVSTLVSSAPAKAFLEKNGIKIFAERTVDAILTKDKTEMCPMEKAARSMDDKELFAHLSKTFNISL